jgi:uncharacterized protein YndB with AHSA1/START domain
MPKPQFVYVTYIAAPAERVWEALTQPEFLRQFWGYRIEGDWRVGGSFRHIAKDGKVAAEGEVLECDPPRRLTITWRWALINGQRWNTPPSSATCLIETIGDVTRLTVSETHDEPVDEDYLEGARSDWPVIVSRMKTFLETGRPLPPVSPGAPS